MKRNIKSATSKVNFLLKRNPRIIRNSEWRKFIPKPYKAVLTITADFELAWAPRYSKNFRNPVETAVKLARRERSSVPLIIEQCDKFNIPITWATVGHLFLDQCSPLNGRCHPEIEQLPHFENSYWKYEGDDWFEYDPCSSMEKDPEWYAPDLIELILNANSMQEIGCHTFSHIDCRDEVCSSAVFQSEMQVCKQLASLKGIDLKSFVHPGHTIGNLENLKSLQFESYQTNDGNSLAYPVRHSTGLWELKRTYEFYYRKGWSDSYHLYRYKKIVDRAIKYNSVCNFWFHPSFSKRFLMRILPLLFDHIDSNRDKILVTTVGNYSSWLNNQKL